MQRRQWPTQLLLVTEWQWCCRFKTKPFQLLMVQPDEYDNGHQQQQQHQHHRSASNLPPQQQLAALRQPSGPTALSDSAASHLAGTAAGAPKPLSLQVPLARRSSTGSGAAAGCSPRQQQPGTPTSDLMARTQIAAVQAAARVSAAASALAAHMTNPQQLWLEKRGSTTGYSEFRQGSSFMQLGLGSRDGLRLEVMDSVLLHMCSPSSTPVGSSWHKDCGWNVGPAWVSKVAAATHCDCC